MSSVSSVVGWCPASAGPDVGSVRLQPGRSNGFESIGKLVNQRSHNRIILDPQWFLENVPRDDQRDFIVAHNEIKLISLRQPAAMLGELPTLSVVSV